MSSIILDFPGKTTTIGSNDPFPSDYGKADFDIDKTALAYYLKEDASTRVCSKEVIYRTDTGDELGVHGKQYCDDIKQLNYKTMIDNQREGIRGSGLNMLDTQEVISVGDGGGKCFIKHTLPHENFTTPGGDTAALTLLGASSLNGIWPLTLSVGANQGACQNNQIFTANAAMLYTSKHNKQLDIDKGYKLIAKSIEVFSQEVDLWHNWSNMDISNAEAFLMFAKTAKCKYVLDYAKQYGVESIDPVSLMLEKKVYSSSALIHMFEDKWLRHYKRVLGSNYWAAYNTITDWASHGFQSARGRKVSAENLVFLNRERSNHARKIIKANFSLAA